MKKAEPADQTLDSDAARLQVLTELTSDWYWEQDVEYRFVSVAVDSSNHPQERAGTFIGKTRWDNPTTSLSEEAWSAHRAMLDARKPFRNLEYSRRGVDGEVRWVSISGAPKFDAQGRFTGYRGIGRDITEGKHAEMLRELEHAIARCLAEADDASAALEDVIHAVCRTQDWEWGRYWRFDEGENVLRGAVHWARPGSRAGKILEASGVVVTALGIGLSGHVLRSGRPLWVADVLADSRVLQKAFSKDIGMHGAFVLPVVAEGKIIGVLSFASTQVRKPDTQLLEAATAIGSQVGQFLRRKQAEEDLRRFRIALDQSADMIFLIDRQTMRYVDVNETACRLLGYTREELVAMGPQDLLPESRENLERAYAALLDDPGHCGSERSHCRCNDGSILPFESSRRVILSSGRSMIAVIARDIRERLAAEAKARDISERLARMNEELETRVSQRTAELETLVRELESFSYSISHDLRAPLRSMGGFAQILLNKHARCLPAEAQAMLGRINANAGRMAQLLDGLLAVARLGRHALQKSRVPMREIALCIWRKLTAEVAGRTIGFEVGALPDCEGDQALLKQVWTNLLSNAIKYTRGIDAARIVIGWEPAGEAYFVRDNGAGFDMRYSDKLFGVFSRLHSDAEFEGTGLGLAICDRILRRHGGWIRGEARRGEGATFYFGLRVPPEPS